MAKRSYDEIENINDVDGPMSSTSIHGAVVTLSPVKKERKAMFFDGLLADESSQIRLVRFQGMQQRKLNDFHQRNVAVALENCQVKPARQGEGYEVMLKTSTIIKESPKKLDVASLMADIATASKTATLSPLESLDVFQKVTVNIKVVELKDETQVGGRVKRDVSVADESSHTLHMQLPQAVDEVLTNSRKIHTRATLLSSGTNHKNLEHVVKNRERMRRIYNTSLQPGCPWPYVHPGRS